jgi:hypothetical protein
MSHSSAVVKHWVEQTPSSCPFASEHQPQTPLQARQLEISLQAVSCL